MRRTLLTLGLILALLTTFSCRQAGEQQSANDTSADTGNLLIGVYADLSGQTSAQGQAIKNGAELARDEINQAGGINGRQIELIVEDDRGVAGQAAQAAGKLIEQNRVRALINGASTTEGLTTAAEKAQSAGVPVITTSVTGAVSRQAGDYVFRVSPTDSFQGEAMAKFAANNLKAGSAAVMFDESSDYGRGLAQHFEEHFSSLGGRIVQKQTFTDADSDMSAQLKSIQSANPDVIYIPSRSGRVGDIARQAKQLDIRATLLGTDGWNVPNLFQVGGKAFDGAYITGHYSSDDPAPDVRRFTSDYRARYGAAPDTHAALAYDATKVLADALRRAEGSGGAKLRDALAQTANLQGVTGTISINPERSAVRPAVIFKLQDGKAYPVFKEQAAAESGQ